MLALLLGTLESNEWAKLLNIAEATLPRKANPKLCVIDLENREELKNRTIPQPWVLSLSVAKANKLNAI